MADPITGNHIIEAIEAHKLQLGLTQDLFRNSLPTLETLLTPTWITHTWHLMEKYDILIEYMNPKLCLHILNNSLLMKDLLKAGYKR